MARRKRKSSSDDWLEDIFKIGLGVLAIAFIAKLSENTQQVTQCPYCYTSIGKWARTCPNCRNNLGI